ncbi:substrate-binding domain-containing protein [Mycobacterium sp.]|uniref:substrate-binding domain-containing protein n=1 Tax=Mycobacterium sp. TaxID=1785 RepID=UPI003A875CEE
MGRHSRPDPDEFVPDRDPEPAGHEVAEGHEPAGHEVAEGHEPAGHEVAEGHEVAGQRWQREPADDHWAPGGYPDFAPPPADFAPPPADFAPPPADFAPPPADFAPSPWEGAAPNPPEASRAGHRSLGDWVGGHRSAGGRRGVSIGVIVALAAVVAVVAVVILWRFFGEALSDRSHSAAARCIGGDDSVAVLADASIVDQVKELADRFNAQAGPIGDRCVAVTVGSAGTDAVIGGLIGTWPAELGNRPGLWIPGSSISAARLSAAAGRETIVDSRSLVTSPVLLALPPEFEQVLENQTWDSLPGLQSNPNSMAALNHPAWGSLRLAMPVAGNGDAVLLAGEAVAAASAPSGEPPTAGVGAVHTLMGAQPELTDDSLTEAMNTLLRPGVDADKLAAAPVHAVITTEQQLFQRGRSTKEADKKLTSWIPPGPVPVADYPTVLLGGPWLSEEQTTAASTFSRFMHKPEQLAKLAAAGFRVSGIEPPTSPVTNFEALPETLSVGDEAERTALADILASPSAGAAVTIMLDQSLPTDDGGGRTRLANVVSALDSRIKVLPPTAVVGLWTFDGHEGRTEVTAGPLADDVDGRQRSEVLLAALDRQYASDGGAVSFTTLRMIYENVQAGYRSGQANSILVITAGPHTDRTLDGAGLQDFIKANADPAKPIAVNVIDFGDDPDRATWEAVAQLSGGSYQNLSTSASPELAGAVNNFLS